MDTLMKIAVQLGLDGSLFYQLLVALVYLVLAKFLFFNKLLAVIHSRYEKTEGAMHLAHEDEEKKRHLEQEYKEKMDLFFATLQQEITKKKADHLLQMQQKMKKSEEEAAKKHAQEMFIFHSTLEEKKGQMKKELPGLVDSFLSKLG